MHLDKIAGIPTSTLSALHSARLRTVSHVLSLPHSTLHELTSLSRSSLRTLLSLLHSATAARGTPASALPPVPPPLPSGAPALDAALVGGLHPRRVAQLAGASGAGKTQLALALAAAAVRVGGVVWLDSSSTHAVFTRVSDILTADGVSSGERDVLLRRLVVLPASTVDDALKSLRLLRKDVAALRSAPGLVAAMGEDQGKILADALKRLRLLVFDSVANVLAPVLGLRDGAWSGHVALNHVAVELRWFASQVDASVLITNRVVKDGVRTKPALGNSWAALVDVSVAMERVGEYGAVTPRWDERRGRVVVRARIASKRASRTECVFQVCEEGVKDVEEVGEDRW